MNRDDRRWWDGLRDVLEGVEVHLRDAPNFVDFESYIFLKRKFNALGDAVAGQRKLAEGRKRKDKTVFDLNLPGNHARTLQAAFRISPYNSYDEFLHAVLRKHLRRHYA